MQGMMCGGPELSVLLCMRGKLMIGMTVCSVISDPFV